MAEILNSLVDLAREDPLLALERLDGVINDVRPDVRIMAITTLTRIAPIVEESEDPKIVKNAHDQVSSMFAARVGDPDEQVRALAVDGMSQVIKRGDQDAGRRVAVHLKDWRGGVRRSAVDAMGRLFIGGLAKSAVLKLLLACLDDDDAEVRHATARALTAVSPKGDSLVVPALTAYLDAKKGLAKTKEVQGIYCEALWQIAKPGDRITAEALGRTLAESDEPRARCQAVMGLGKLGACDDPEFLEAGGRSSCIEALCVAVGSRSGLPLLNANGLEEEPEDQKPPKDETDADEGASSGSGRSGEAPSEAESIEEAPSKTEVATTQATLEQAEGQIADPLGEADPAAEVVDPAEAEVQPEAPAKKWYELEEEDMQQQEEPGPVAPTLGELYPHLLLDVLRKDGDAAQDEDPNVRCEALRSLTQVARRGDRRALAAALICLRDSAQEVREEAVTAIAALNPHGDLAAVISVAQILMEGADNYGNPDERQLAIRTLAAIATVGDDSVAAVVSQQLNFARMNGLPEANATERCLLLEALSGVAPQSCHEDVEQALLFGLEDVSAEVRRRALELLPPFVDADRKQRARDAIMDRLKDRDPGVKAAAAKALKAMDADGFSPMRAVSVTCTGTSLIVQERSS